MLKVLRISPGYLLLLLWTLLTAVLFGWIIAASLSTTREIFTNTIFSTGIHFDNYAHAFIDNHLMVYFGNSMIYTSTSLVFIVLIAAPAAYVLARFKFMGNKLIRNMFVFAMGIPQVMIVLPLFSLATRLHITNTRLAVIILYTCTTIPFTVFFLISFFATLPGNLEEAAEMDGCSPARAFWIIMFPLAQPGLITVVIFDFIALWNEYFIALIFAAKSSLRPVGVGLFALIQSMRYVGDWAGMFAAVVMVFMPTLILYILLSEKIVQSVTAGAIKG